MLAKDAVYVDITEMPIEVVVNRVMMLLAWNNRLRSQILLCFSARCVAISATDHRQPRAIAA